MKTNVLSTPLPHADAPRDCQSKEGCQSMAHFGVVVTAGPIRWYKTLCPAHHVDVLERSANGTLVPDEKPAPPVLEKIEQLVNQVADATRPKRPPLIFEIRKDAQPVTCKTCGESVVWIITSNLKKMPVEAFGPHRGESHFAFCPQANQHRKKKS